ncbi:MAG: hypothetical protein HQK88_16995 [Nitrospirae bacterium]|nr:hypothetical protein [Nitrospirota bacterium]MBF0618498.1 hypothetical protein [Nitrospirota bacterium]
MKKIIVYTLTTLLIMMTVSLMIETKADSATYYMPYLHTSTSNVVYCVVTNVSSSPVNGSFTTMSVENGTATQTTGTSFSVDAKTTQLMTFSGSTLTTGTSTITISDVSASTISGYSGKLAFIGTSSPGDTEFGGGVTASTVSCTDVPMSCFQGTTSPKRNLVGHNCEDGTNKFAY